MAEVNDHPSRFITDLIMAGGPGSFEISQKLWPVSESSFDDDPRAAAGGPIKRALKLSQDRDNFQPFSAIIHHDAPMTQDIADLLEANYPEGGTASEWMQRQADYNAANP